MWTYFQTKREKNQVVATVQRVVFENTDDVLEALGTNSEGKISTSYVERINLTIRNSLARFIRKGMNCSKSLVMHSRAIDFFQTWYNFIKPHDSLKVGTRPQCLNRRIDGIAVVRKEVMARMAETQKQ